MSQLRETSPTLAFEPARVAIAEDDAELRALIRLVLENEGYRVTEICDGAELLEFIADHLTPDGGLRGVDLLISDHRMPGFPGLHVVSAFRRASGSTPVILITAFGDELTHETARALGVRAVLDKPFEMDCLTSEVLTALSAAG